MKRQAYIKPQVRALMIQHSGVVCASLTYIEGDVNYGGEGGDEEPRAHINFNVWEEDEDNKTNSDPKSMFDKESFLSVLR